MNAKIQMAMDGLINNNMKPYFVPNREEALALVKSLLHHGDTVTAGGSATLFQCGIIDLLRSGSYHFLDRYADGVDEERRKEIYYRAMDADVYFCSSNAVTLAGELYNVDGNSNRISAVAYGPKSVVMVVGRNKIVKDAGEAVRRVKTVTAPKICKRAGRKTYCCETGRCISLDNGSESMTAGCDSPDRTCCSFLLLGKQRVRDRIKVIIVGENLGY